MDLLGLERVGWDLEESSDIVGEQETAPTGPAPGQSCKLGLRVGVKHSAMLTGS